MDYLDMYKRWLKFDPETKKELDGLDDNEIKDRFYKELEFGTGGLRGVIAAGTNRMNVYTVRKATQGLANYIIKNKCDNPSVAIAYDSRKYSYEFARDAALVLNANGIKTFIYDELKPTPMLSYAVRHLHTTAGIVVTASHNPKQYNGYKVYWSDGGQITEEHAAGILKEIKNADYDDIRIMNIDEAKAKGLFNYVSEDTEDSYINLVKGLCINKKVINDFGKDMRIIYTPLHGTGNKPVRRVLNELGFKNVDVVKEQELPNSEFPTVKYPNPEEHDAFRIAIEMAKKEGADLILGTDPDCDRVGVVVKDKKGEYSVLTGNQTGSLLTYYMLSQLKETGKMPEKPAVVKTIVTTELARKICEDFNVKIFDVLTGFKYIGEKIKEFEEKTHYSFIIGYEESYGYLSGTFVRDKDGVIACSLISEMTAYYKSKGMSLYDALMNLYKKYGYYKESLKSLVMTGMEGNQKICSIMDDLRENTPLKFNASNVIRLKDYKKGIDRDLVNDNQKTIDLPKSNVIQMFLEDGSIITARPSGTEPKIKFYFASIGSSLDDAQKKVQNIQEELIAKYR